MTYLRNCWYQAGWTDEVSVGIPLVRRILDEPILFYRTDGGELAALLDRCPHRFAPLSAGKIDGDNVVCGYHGLGFSPAGACILNPHGPITSTMKVRSYPVAERHTAIWIWMGDSELCDPCLIPDLSFIDETVETARIRMYLPTAANYELLVDNIMDLSHADYLHPTSIGGIMVDAKASTKREGNSIVAEWLSENCTPPPAFVPIVGGAEKADIWTEVVWQAPGVMILGTAANPAGVPRTPADESYTLHNMVPETATSTHYFVCSTRRFLLEDEEFSKMLRSALEHAFRDEDKPIIEQQQARIGQEDFWDLQPILLPVDAGAVRVRRMLRELIDAENNAEVM